MSQSVSSPASSPASSAKPAGWLAATLPVVMIAACTELGISVLGNSALPVYFTRGLHLSTHVMGYLLIWFYISESLFKSPLGMLAIESGASR